MQTIIKKWGNSNGIVIPKALLDQLELTSNDKVDLSLIDDAIVIKKQTSTIEMLFDGYEGDYKPDEFDFGKPVGKEIW